MTRLGLQALQHRARTVVNSTRTTPVCIRLGPPGPAGRARNVIGAAAGRARGAAGRGGCPCRTGRVREAKKGFNFSKESKPARRVPPAKVARADYHTRRTYATRGVTSDVNQTYYARRSVRVREVYAIRGIRFSRPCSSPHQRPP